MSKQEENIQKTNGPGIDPMQRLASFKPPRDFTLGCANVRPSKKIFTPNLNVTRNKKGSVAPNLIDNKRIDKNRRDQKRDGNKNFKNVSKIIKATGIFSEGLGSIERHSSRPYYARENEPTQRTKKPGLNLIDFAKTDKDALGERLDTLLEEADDLQKVEHIQENDEPIKLPMSDGGWLYSEPKPAIKIKQEVSIKTEPMDEGPSALLDIKPFPRVKEEAYDHTDVANVVNRDASTLLFLQMPDSLPASGGCSEEPKIKSKPTTSTDSPESKEILRIDPRCKMLDLQEGRIGKLKTHRSGRVTLSLGEVLFEVNSGMLPAFYQEAVSLSKEESSRSATLASLGPLHHKLNVIPNWEFMFYHMVL